LVSQQRPEARFDEAVFITFASATAYLVAIKDPDKYMTEAVIADHDMPWHRPASNP
jgi:hypothetical protein